MVSSWGSWQRRCRHDIIRQICELATWGTTRTQITIKIRLNGDQSRKYIYGLISAGFLKRNGQELTTTLKAEQYLAAYLKTEQLLSDWVR